MDPPAGRQEASISPGTPTSVNKKGILSGSKAYLRPVGKSKSVVSPGGTTEQDNKSFHRSMSETAINAIKSSRGEAAPSTPKSTPRKPRHFTTSKKGKMPTSESPLPTSGNTALLDPPLTPGTPVPGTPKARMKIRRSLETALDDLCPEDVASVPDSAMAVITPTKKKKEKRRGSLGALADAVTKKKDKRRGSLGALETAIMMSPRGAKDRDSKRSARRSNNASDDQQQHEPEDMKSPTSTKNPKAKAKINGVEDLMKHLAEEDDLALLKSPAEGSKRGKLRSTVDASGKIRRIRDKSADRGGNGSDGEETRKSTRSKGSVRSAGSKMSRKTRESDTTELRRRKREGSKRELEDDEPKKVEDPLSISNHSEKSDRSDRSARRDRSIRGERRAGKRDGGSQHDSESLSGRPPPFVKTELSSRSNRRINSISSELSDGGDPIENGSGDKSVDLHAEIRKLNQIIIEMKEEHLKTQFQSQSEATKLRKELREEKLELQKSQTERRELRAELRERDFIIDESDRKIQTLEKAVESQLDKVDDLEDELKRANEEIFDLEEKLAHMERVLADSAAASGEGAAKEREMARQRQERLERRLKEREQELEQREQKLREERDSLLAQNKPKQEVDQLEQDNRMLLKALSREKAEAANLVKEREKEIESLKAELKRARTRSYSQSSASSDGNGSVTELMKENDRLHDQLSAARNEKSLAERKKDEKISELEAELKRLKDEVKSRDMGDFDHIKREVDAKRAEAEVMKSKFEGALRRNLILEEDIDHWKSVNCNLEDEVAELKSQVAEWRSRYNSLVDGNDNDHSTHHEPNILAFSMPRGGPMSAAEMAMSRHDDSDHGPDSGNTISNLWSKLTTPSSRKPAVSTPDDSSQVREMLARSTFH